MKPYLSSHSDCCQRSFLGLMFVLGVASSAMTGAEEGGLGRITGRVSNPTTHEYLNRAEIEVAGGASVYTDADGSFTVINVPAGSVTLTANYIGFDSITVSVQVQAGATTTHDFELSPKGVVRLEAFRVSDTTLGDAKAIMDQRATLNLKNIIPSESFGENPDGNIGEFLKLMPGVTIDYAFIQARGLRLNGIDPKYSTISQDGMTLSSAGTAAFASSSRAFDMDAYSISGIETVELNKTLTAGMEASSVAGNVNLISKSAFSRERRLASYDISLTANTQALTLARSPGWLQEKQYKIGPNIALGYADVFMDHRLGVSVTYSDSSRWSPRFYQQSGYDFSQLATRGPVITSQRFGDEAVMVRGTSVGLNVDFKATARLVLSLRSGYSQRELPGLRRIFNLITTAADSPTSSLTDIVTKANGTNTRIEFTGDTLNEKFTVSQSISPRFKFTADTYELSGGADYSLGTAQYFDMHGGFFNVAQSRLSSMSWTAQRSDPFSTDWVVSQTSGRPWLDPSSWNRDSAIANNIATQERKGTTEKIAEYLNATIPLRLALPLTLKAGGQNRQVGFKLRGLGSETWSYVGAGTSQTAPTAEIPTETIYSDNRRMNGGVPNWPRPDRQKLYQIYRAFPSYFIPNTVPNFQQVLIYPKTVKEHIDAAYLEGNTHLGKLRLDLGARYEETRTKAWRTVQLSAAAIAATRPDLTPGTIPYVLYQFNNGVQPKFTSSYGNLFLSGGGKYQILKNLDAQVSFSNGILRPDYNNIAGAISENDTTRIVTVPNVDLKPELSTKYYAGVSYYFEPAGSINVGVYKLRIKNLQTTGVPVSQASAGYADYAQYNNYTFFTSVNVPGYQATNGIELDLRQQLIFLPGPLKGLSVYGSFSRVIADRVRLGVVNRSGSAGIGYRYRGLAARVNGTWQGNYLVSNLSTGTQWMRERASIDAEVSYRFQRGLTVYINSRNLSDAPFLFYDVLPNTHQHVLDNVARYGAFWTAGVKRQF